MTYTLYPFIESKYKKVFDAKASDISETFRYYQGRPLAKFFDYPEFSAGSKLFPYWPVDCTLQNLSQKDVKMLLSADPDQSLIAYLYFEELPDVPGDYDIMVEIIDESGKVYTSDLTMKFDF